MSRQKDAAMTVRWPVEVDEVLDGDQVVAVASVTPAGGVVISPMTNFAVHDRQSGIVKVNSSVGASKKLDRMRANPNVALAFHSRAFSASSRSEYVVVQGNAKVLPPVPDYPAIMGHRWDEKDGPPPRGIWAWWLRTYYTRIPIDISVERVIVWPDLSASGTPRVYGAALPPSPQPQKPPSGGTASRVDPHRVRTLARRLPHLLIGWLGDDGRPMLVPVEATACAQDALQLSIASPLLPPGGRRGGLLAHQFSKHLRGEEQRIYTGWVENTHSSNCAAYHPHTAFGFRLPPSTTLYRLLVGFSARRGARANSAASRRKVPSIGRVSGNHASARAGEATD
jgi:general stress protein 26